MQATTSNNELFELNNPIESNNGDNWLWDSIVGDSDLSRKQAHIKISKAVETPWPTRISAKLQDWRSIDVLDSETLGIRKNAAMYEYLKNVWWFKDFKWNDFENMWWKTGFEQKIKEQLSNPDIMLASNINKRRGIQFYFHKQWRFQPPYSDACKACDGVFWTKTKLIASEKLHITTPQKAVDKVDFNMSIVESTRELWEKVLSSLWFSEFDWIKIISELSSLNKQWSKKDFFNSSTCKEIIKKVNTKVFGNNLDFWNPTLYYTWLRECRNNIRSNKWDSGWSRWITQVRPNTLKEIKNQLTSWSIQIGSELKTIVLSSNMQSLRNPIFGFLCGALTYKSQELYVKDIKNSDSMEDKMIYSFAQWVTWYKTNGWNSEVKRLVTYDWLIDYNRIDNSFERRS